MNCADTREKAVCFVVQNLQQYQKLYPKLEKRFSVTMLEVQDKYEARNRFDKKRRVLQEVANSFKLFVKSQFYLKHDVILCFARKRHLSYLVFARVLNLLGLKLKLYLFGFYIQSWRFSALKRYLVAKVMTDNIGMLVISKSDLSFLKSLAPKVDLRYYPFCQAPKDPEDISKASLGDYIFAGGHTNRDYDTVLKCAESMPNVKFVVVWSSYTEVRHPIPPNVKVYKDLDGRDFYDLLANSRLVLIPILHKGFSAGQTIALAAMQYGKTTIYSNFENVSQYFENGVTGIEFVSRDVGSLEEAIKQVFNDNDRLSNIGRAAQEKYLNHYTRDKLEDALFAHICDFTNGVTINDSSINSDYPENG